MKKISISQNTRDVVIDSARTSIAAVVSLVTARLFGLPEAYWAPLTTFVVVQSTFGAAIPASLERFIGTALGAGVGAFVATYINVDLLLFGIVIFSLGLFCGAVGLTKSAYRFACITVALVILVKRISPSWEIALHRFIEVSIGIVVGLIVSALWPRQTLKENK